LLGFVRALRIVVFSITEIGVGDGSYEDMRNVITLGKIEAIFIFLVEIFDLRIRYRDLRRDL